VVVWFPHQKLLFGGCLVKSVDTNSIGNLADADVAEWPDTIRALWEMFPDVRTVVPGHFGWEKPGTLEHTLELLESRGKMQKE